MQTELTNHNIERISHFLKEVEGKTIVVNNTTLAGVKSIGISKGEVYDGDPIPDEGYTGKCDVINIVFNFSSGTATYSFRPDIEHCQISYEQDDIWVFCIEDMKKYLDREKFNLEFRLSEYMEYMSK